MTADEQALASCREWLGRVADLDPRAGLYDEAGIVEAMEEIIRLELGTPSPALLFEFAALARAGLEAQAVVEATWTQRTANDALDDAFDDLNVRGIIAVQALGNTTQEGSWKISALGRERGGGLRGHAFYHRQDLERALDGQGLYLSFDTLALEFDEPPKTVKGADSGDGFLTIVPVGLNDVVGLKGEANRPRMAAIAEEILHVLAHHQVVARWSGNPFERIELKPFAWQKRRTSKRPPGRGHAGPVPPPPAAPPPCEHCGGKGWLQPDPAKFPEKCACRGGKPRPAANVAAGTTDVGPTVSAPAEAVAVAAAALPTVSTAPIVGPAPTTVAAATLPVVSTGAVAQPATAAVGSLSQATASRVGAFDVVAFTRAAAPVLLAVVLAQAWKKPPIVVSLMLAAIALVVAAVRATRRRS